MVHFAYSNEYIKTTELTSRLEPSFHVNTVVDAFVERITIVQIGWAHPDHAISDKFFAVLHNAVPQDCYNRLWYIVAMQNWQPMHAKYWVRQAVQVSKKKEQVFSGGNASLVVTALLTP